MAPKARPRSGKRVSNGLVALSSAAVLSVYSAGYLRTRAAAEKLDAAERSRIVIPDSPGDWSGRRAEPVPADATAAVTPAASQNTGTDESATGARKDKPARGAVTAVAATTDPNPLSSPATPVAVTSVTATAVPATSVAATAVAVTPVAAPPVAPAAIPAPIAAPEPTVTPAPTPTPQPPQYKDGTYSGWGTSRHGDIEATVVIAAGRITSAVISQCLTRYSCSWVAHLQGQVVTRQSAEVDYVSGATQSANAFYYAVVQALSKAK